MSIEEELKVLGELRNSSQFSETYYFWNHETEEHLKTIIKVLLNEYEKPEWNLPFFIIMKDLLMNANKANMKRAYFEETDLNIHHAGDYDFGLRNFKSLILKGKIHSLQEKSRSLGLCVELILEHSRSGVQIEIINNSPMVREEAKKIRNSLLSSQEYSDITQYQKERADDSEGEGLGIPLIIMTLKYYKIPPQNFTIYSSAGKTISKVEIPF